MNTNLRNVLLTTTLFAGFGLATGTVADAATRNFVPGMGVAAKAAGSHIGHLRLGGNSRIGRTIGPIGRVSIPPIRTKPGKNVNGRPTQPGAGARVAPGNGPHHPVGNRPGPNVAGAASSGPQVNGLVPLPKPTVSNGVAVDGTSPVAIPPQLRDLVTSFGGRPDWAGLKGFKDFKDMQDARGIGPLAGLPNPGSQSQRSNDPCGNGGSSGNANAQSDAMAGAASRAPVKDKSGQAEDGDGSRSRGAPGEGWTKVNDDGQGSYTYYNPSTGEERYSYVSPGENGSGFGIYRHTWNDEHGHRRQENIFREQEGERRTQTVTETAVTYSDHQATVTTQTTVNEIGADGTRTVISDERHQYTVTAQEAPHDVRYQRPGRKHDDDEGSGSGGEDSLPTDNSTPNPDAEKYRPKGLGPGWNSQRRSAGSPVPGAQVNPGHTEAGTNAGDPRQGRANNPLATPCGVQAADGSGSATSEADGHGPNLNAVINPVEGDSTYNGSFDGRRRGPGGSGGRNNTVDPSNPQRF